MTSISSQTAASTLPIYTATTSTGGDTVKQSATSVSTTSNSQSASTTPSAADISAAEAAGANSGSYSFSTVAQNALTVVNAGIAKVGSQPSIYTTGAQWNQIFGNLDRRSLYAISTNEGGKFTTLEQQVANSTLQNQVSQALGPPGQNGYTSENFQNVVKFLQNVSPEEQQSIGWATNIANAQVSYSETATTEGKTPTKLTSTNPLVQVLIAAETAAQGNSSTDRTIGSLNSIADIKSQPWAKGFESQIDSAYASYYKSGSSLNITA